MSAEKASDYKQNLGCKKPLGKNSVCFIAKMPIYGEISAKYRNTIKKMLEANKSADLLASSTVRRVRDSNPCEVALKRFSRPPRYDHFGNPPYTFCKTTTEGLQSQDFLYSIKDKLNIL